MTTPKLVWSAIGAAIVLGCFLRFLHLGDVGERSPDEDTYTYFSARIAESGLRVTPALFQEFAERSDLQNYPAPTRLTYPVLEAAVMRLSEVRDASAGVAVSFVFSCLSLVLLAWIGIRFFDPRVALAAVIFMAFSVGELAMSRRAWQDTAFGFLGLLMMYVTCEIAENPGERRWVPAFLSLGTLALLTKQTGVILYGVCGLWVFWLMVKARLRQPAIVLVLGGAASVAFAVAVWILAAGGTGEAITAMKLSINPGERAIAYMREFSSCPWYEFLGLLFITGPVPLLLASYGAVVVVRRDRRNAAVCALLLSAAFVLFSAGYPLMQNLRYLSPANGAWCLLAAIGFWQLVALVKQSSMRWALAAVVVLALFRDYALFNSAIVQPGIVDLAVKLIRKHA